MPYRAGDDLSERIARSERTCRHLAARLTETYWALLEAESPIHRDPSEAIAEVTATGPEHAEQIHRALLRYEERLESAVANANEVHRQLVTLPGELPAKAARPPWSESEGTTIATVDYVRMPSDSRTSLLHDVAHCLGGLDAEANLETRHGAIFAAPIQLAGAPMAVLVEPVSLTSDVDLTLTTPVRRALAPIRLERFTSLHTLTTAVRLHSDARVGDREFDDHFLVTASETAARHLLDPEVRDDLMGLAHFATPRLELSLGLATLRFRYAFSPMLLERVARILVRIRSREIDVRLLHSA